MLGRLWPRFALEAFFLISVALVAGLLNLSVSEVIVVMAVAYGLTVVVELGAWRAFRPRRSAAAGPALAEVTVFEPSGGSVVVRPGDRPPRPEEEEAWLDRLAPPEREPEAEVEAEPEVEVEVEAEPEAEAEVEVEPEDEDEDVAETEVAPDAAVKLESEPGPEPDQPEFDQPEPDQPEPDQPEPDQPEPDQPEPHQPGPNPEHLPTAEPQPAEPQPEPEPEPEPESEREPEPELVQVAAAPQLTAVPELEPARVAEPVPATAPVATLPLPAQPQEWNLWELERLTRERGGGDPVRDVEWGYLVVYLREFARPDGTLPAEFDDLVRESFGDILATRAR